MLGEHGTAGGDHEVGKSHGDSIGSIFRRRRGAEPEELRHHVAHLRLQGCTSSYNGFLDRGRRVLRKVHPGELAGQQDHSPRMTQHHRGANVAPVKGAFDSQCSRSVAAEQLTDALIEHTKADWKRSPRRGGQRPAFDQHGMPARPVFDHPIPHHRGSRIDAEHPHWGALRLPPRPAALRRYRSWRKPWRRHPALRARP